MEKSLRTVPLIYGYLVCLVAIIVGLISISMLIGAVFNLQDPLRSNTMRFGYSGDLSSFEGYKMTATGSRLSGAPVPATPAESKPSDVELHTAYDAAKADQIASVNLDAHRSITTGLLLLVAAAILFLTHWRWLARFNQPS